MSKNKILLLLLVSTTYVNAQMVDFGELYKSWGVSDTFTVTKQNSQDGEDLWNKELITDKSCASCHGTNLKISGKHIKTNKKIKAMSPEINQQRLTKVKKINKWLKRNCKFTYKRECTTLEKINFIEFIKNN